jgi:thioester reductase-like protein
MQVFLTGASGFLGGELLVELANRPEVDRIFCLVRASDENKASERLAKVFDLHHDHFDSVKVVPVVGDLSSHELSSALIADIRLQHIDVIIHAAANTSFSKMAESNIEAVNIGGTHQILLWAKTLKFIKVFTYVGTAAICGGGYTGCVVTEDQSPDLASKHLVRYSYTKMIGELLVKEHLPTDKTLIVRPSIIMGDSRPWVPRSNVILWALSALNHMRLFPVDPDSPLDIISIDYAVKAIIALLFVEKRNHQVYHISAGTGSSTTPGKLTRTIHHEDILNGKPSYRFTSKNLLQNLKKWSREDAPIDRHDPLFQYQSYLNYWIDHFGNNSKLRILLHGLEPYINFIELGQTFDNSRLMADTDVGPSIPADVYIKNSIAHINAINIFEGAIDP